MQLIAIRFNKLLQHDVIKRMSRPGFEPAFLLPQRNAITTRGSGPITWASQFETCAFSL